MNKIRNIYCDLKLLSDEENFKRKYFSDFSSQKFFFLVLSKDFLDDKIWSVTSYLIDIIHVLWLESLGRPLLEF